MEAWISRTCLPFPHSVRACSVPRMFMKSPRSPTCLTGGLGQHSRPRGPPCHHCSPAFLLPLFHGTKHWMVSGVSEFSDFQTLLQLWSLCWSDMLSCSASPCCWWIPGHFLSIITSFPSQEPRPFFPCPSCRQLWPKEFGRLLWARHTSCGWGSGAIKCGSQAHFFRKDCMEGSEKSRRLCSIVPRESRRIGTRRGHFCLDIRRLVGSGWKVLVA